MYSLQKPNSFVRGLKKLTKKYAKSIGHINNAINSLTENPTQGDIYPGFGNLAVRKMRIGLPEYKLGKSKGLRLLYLSIKDKRKVVPLVIYAKKAYGGEQAVRHEIVSALKDMMSDLKG